MWAYEALSYTLIHIMRKIGLGICTLFVLAIITYAYYHYTVWWEWSPVCAFKLLMGLECPTCGSQRALFYFLHGQWNECLMQNQFLIYVMFCIVLYCVLKFFKCQHSYNVSCSIFLIGYIICFIIRNIPKNIAS